MTHRGPFQALTFCDSVKQGRVEVNRLQVCELDFFFFLNGSSLSLDKGPRDP